MDPFPFGTSLTIVVLLFCLILVAFLLRRIVNKIRQSTGFEWAIYLYFFICIWPVYEIVKIIGKDYPWIKNPFFYFWFLFLLYSVMSFFVEGSKQKENRNG